MGSQVAPSATETRTRSRRLLRSTAAVGAGLVANVVLGLGTDQILHAVQVYPPWGQPMGQALFLLATAYRAAYGIAGGYVTARLAPDRPMRHALVLGFIGAALSTIGAVATWNAGPAFGPKWYPLSLIPLAIVCSWLGGVIHRSRQRADEQLNSR